MAFEKRIHQQIKSNLHPRNKHRERYNFEQLVNDCPELAPFVLLNEYNDRSIDFFNPEAVKLLNKALLKHYYSIDEWDIPKNYLCPPIPGRADYLHHIADLLGSCQKGKIPVGQKIRSLDIGVGANCVYPIIGRKEYGWSFVGSDIDELAIQSAGEIIQANSILKEWVEIRHQQNSESIFEGIIKENERFDLTICNPPFHTSAQEAQKGTLRKLSNLKGKSATHAVLNFGGTNHELWCKGGEEQFIRSMIQQSVQFATSCFWFSSLVSKESTLKPVYRELSKNNIIDFRTINMGQGNKVSRIIAWTFLTPKQQSIWAKTRWGT